MAMEKKDDQKRRGLLDRLREMLESLEKALTPARPVPQPIPVRGDRKPKS